VRTLWRGGYPWYVDDSALVTSRSVYERLARRSALPSPRVRAWDGTEWGSASAKSTIVLQHPGALRALLLPPSDLIAGEAYVFDDVDIEGDIYETLRWAAGLSANPPGRIAALRLMRDLRTLPDDARRYAAQRPRFGGRLHTRRRDRDAVSYHYDTGNDFYSLFLGETMAYSCAYYLDPTEDLNTAQRRKLDLVCRKLGLAEGRTLLDVGCGWGSLVIHAASKYGVEAIGVTVSKEQAVHAREWATDAGVGDRVRIINGDYRDVRGQFDAVASIGMVEHVGRKKLRTYFDSVASVLKPNGLFINHGITTRSRSNRRNPTFVNTYVFPDGELTPLDVRLTAAEKSGFEIRDVESLRMSYALTLREWVKNVEASRDEAIKATSQEVYRIWRAYMAGSAIAFERGDIGVYQALMTHPGAPWTYGRKRLLASDDA